MRAFVAISFLQLHVSYSYMRSTLMQACGDMALLHKLADAHRSSAQQLALLSADTGECISPA